jgi:hypothetical protein
VLMAVTMCPLLFRHLRLYPAMWQEENNASIRRLSGSVSLNLNCVYACTVPDLLVADQKMLLNLWHSFNKSLSGFCAKKLPGLFLRNLQQFDMLKKQHFEKKISRRIMQSAIRLFCA